MIRRLQVALALAFLVVAGAVRRVASRVRRLFTRTLPAIWFVGLPLALIFVGVCNTGCAVQLPPPTAIPPSDTHVAVQEANVAAQRQVTSAYLAVREAYQRGVLSLAVMNAAHKDFVMILKHAAALVTETRESATHGDQGALMMRVAVYQTHVQEFMKQAARAMRQAVERLPEPKG